MARRWMIVGLLSFTLASPARAGESVELGTVLVSPRRVPGLFVNASEFPGNATVITEEEIQHSGATSLPELLARQEGVTFMDTNGFGLGADGSVNLRGIVNSSRTNALVLINGVRQNRLTGDEVHWQSIPPDQVERIEILRGGGSLIYGEGALAGVISITTKKGAERLLETESGFEWGSFGQQRYVTSARGQAGALTYGTSYTRRLLSGYRESTNSRATTITNHVGLELAPSLRIETNVLHSEDTSYFAGGITSEASQERRRQKGPFPTMSDDRTEQVSFETIWAGEAGLSAVATAFWKFRESDSDSAGSRFATITPSIGLSLRGSHEQELGDVRHTLISGIELLDEKASTGTRGADFSESNKGSYGLFAEETLRLFDRLSLVGGLRFDKARFDEAILFPAFTGTLRFEGWSPKVGASLDIAKPLTVYANFARPFKSPNVDDFAAAVPSGFVGNIDLQPQQGFDYEVGLRVREPKLATLDAAWFYTRIDDEILFNDLPGNDQNQNFDTVRYGLETSLTPALPIPGLTTTLTYTFIDAEFRKGQFKENTLPGVPEHRVTSNITYEVLPKLFLSLDWLFVQDFFRVNDFNNVIPGDNYGVVNLGARYVHEHVTVYARIENATNEEYTTFQSSNGVTVSTGENPAPPTSFLLGITLKF